jgi:uncharacterized damage-inducible protein DinB
MTSPTSRTLSALYRHNDWANRRVFDTVLGVEVQRLDAQAGGTYGSISGTLKHLVQVESVYLQMLSDREPKQDPGEAERCMAQDLGWFAARAAELSEGFQTLIAAADDSFLDAPLHVPWFDFPLTKHDGLLQVLAHSAQHRAQVLSALGAQGVEVPDVDYVEMVGEETT